MGGIRPGAGEAAIARITGFWRNAGQAKWFAKDGAFDAAFRERFLGLHMAAAARRRDAWGETAEGALALLLLTDQFPRNAFRGTAHMYATDPLARHYARQALSARHMDRVAVDLRPFFCLPFSHSENLDDQELSVALHRRLGPPWLAHAEGHRDIIHRFGRFPHRNSLLGRETTAEEARFLREGGFSG